MRSRFQTLHRNPNLLDQQSARGAGGDQMTSLQSLAIERREGNQVRFLAIVRNDCHSGRANARHFVNHRIRPNRVVNSCISEEHFDAPCHSTSHATRPKLMPLLHATHTKLISFRGAAGHCSDIL
jgi:hypothetical protein